MSELAVNDYAGFLVHPKLQPLAREISWTKNPVIMAGCKDVLGREFYSPDFNPVEFDGIRKQAGLNLSNLENLNALYISQGQSQPERLIRLNQIAIQQMNILTASENVPMLTAREGER